MILFPELRAVATCEAADCDAATPVAIALSSAGTLAGAATTAGWQFVGTDSVFHSYCPQHHQEIHRPLIHPGTQIGPRGPRSMNGHGKGKRT